MSVTEVLFEAVDKLAAIGEKLTPGGKVQRLTDRILTLGSDGQTREVIELTEFINVTSHDSGGRLEMRPGLKSYQLNTGQRLNRVDADTWRTPGGGLTLHRASR